MNISTQATSCPVLSAFSWSPLAADRAADGWRRLMLYKLSSEQRLAVARPTLLRPPDANHSLCIGNHKMSHRALLIATGVQTAERVPGNCQELRHMHWQFEHLKKARSMTACLCQLTPYPLSTLNHILSQVNLFQTRDSHFAGSLWSILQNCERERVKIHYR